VGPSPTPEAFPTNRPDDPMAWHGKWLLEIFPAPRQILLASSFIQVLFAQEMETHV